MSKKLNTFFNCSDFTRKNVLGQSNVYGIENRFLPNKENKTQGGKMQYNVNLSSYATRTLTLFISKMCPKEICFYENSEHMLGTNAHPYHTYTVRVTLWIKYTNSTDIISGFLNC